MKLAELSGKEECRLIGVGEEMSYLCKQCGRPVELRDNQTYCEHCGPGAELVAVADETSVYGMDCRSGRCEA